MKNLFIIIIFCLITNLLLSQNNNPNKKRENREAIKIAFFTKKMDLNTVESQNFWPLVNDMEAELKALKNKNSHVRMMLKEKEEISDKELEEIMDAKMEMGKSQIDIKIKYHEKFKEVLPIKKVAKYYEVSKEFKKIQTKRKTHHINPGQRYR